MPVLHAVALVALLALGPPAANIKAGTASGTVKVNGQAAPLKFAYLTTEKYQSDPKGGIVITMTDAPVTAEQLDSSIGWNSLAREGKIHAVIIKVGKDKQVYSGEIYHGAMKNWPHTAISGLNEFDAKVFTPARVQGRAYMKAPYKGSDDELFYDVTFDTAGESK